MGILVRLWQSWQWRTCRYRCQIGWACCVRGWWGLAIVALRQPYVAYLQLRRS